jgi:hypothetical protein
MFASSAHDIAGVWGDWGDNLSSESVQIGTAYIRDTWHLHHLIVPCDPGHHQLSLKCHGNSKPSATKIFSFPQLRWLPSVDYKKHCFSCR